MSAISLIIAQFILPSAMAASFEVPVADVDRLIVNGLEAQVQFVGQPGSSIKVQGLDESPAEGSYVLTQKGRVIEIKMNEFSGKSSWLTVLSKPFLSKKKIEILGPSVPAEVRLRGGVITAQNWSKDFKVSLTQGRASVANGSGATQIYVQKGDILVQDHAGPVSVDAYSGTVSLRNIQGDVEASLFSGQLQIEKLRGFLNLATQQSNGKLVQSSGTIQFENGKGSLNIQGFQGRLEGQNQDGSVSVVVDLDSEVDIRSKSGKISVQTPAGSGASVNLLVSDGEILTPTELKVVRSGVERSVRGRLRGDAQRGVVFVRSQEGTISVK